LTDPQRGYNEQAMQEYVIGIDIGGTNIKMGAVDYSGSILQSIKISTEAQKGVDALLERVRSLVFDVMSRLPDCKLRGIGVGIPGAVLFKEGIVTQAPNIPALGGLPIRQMLQDRIEAPCFLENDANAIALGEFWQGAGRGYKNICLLTLGTGTGGGVIIDGELLHGADGMAAELGHIAVVADGAPCTCGSRGCLETFASANGMLRILAEELTLNSGSALSMIPKQQVTPEIIYGQAKKGDAVAQRVLERAGIGLGVGLASLVNMLNPEIIIIGGGVSAAWDLLIPPAIKVMKQRAFRQMSARVKIVRAAKENDAGIYGCSYLAWHSISAGNAEHSTERCLAPWGFWRVIEDGPEYKVKRLYVHPGHRLSYQKHEQREETWMIADGEALVTLDGKEQRLKSGETLRIPKKALHRIANPGPHPLVFFEVQRGSYFGEDDIVRVQDDYKR
jgi:glucokinase